jgi:hypothetical protein
LTDYEAKVMSLLSLERIMPQDIEHFVDEERRLFMSFITLQLDELKGAKRDKFYDKVEPLVSATTKNELWENNRTQIMRAIAKLMEERGRMPTKTEIANYTELSRQTVHKHLKEYASNPQYFEQMERFRFMAPDVLAKVYQYAVKGDSGAAKLFLNVTGFLNSQNSIGPSVQHHTNFIQINNTAISQETIRRLSPEQLNNIETILRTAPTKAKHLEAKKQISLWGSIGTLWKKAVKSTFALLAARDV